MRSLPSRFDVIVTTIEETKDLSNFIVDKLHASLMTHEQRLGRIADSSLEHAFKTQMFFGRGRGQGRGNYRGKEIARSQNRGRNKSTNTSGKAAIKIRTKFKEVANKVDKIKHMDKDMINPKSNVITVRIMGIMPMNVGRNRVTWIIDLVLTLQKKISVKKILF